MKKALEVAKEISRGYSQDIENEKYKTVYCESVQNDPYDEYTIHYQSKEFSIHATNPRAAAYAMSQLKAHVMGKHHQDIIGVTKPLYKLRPIWIRSDQHVSLTENVGCYLPSFFLGKKRNNFEKFCQRILELGFNAVILGSRGLTVEQKSTTSFKELQVLHQLFGEYGIHLIIKPVVYTPPGDSSFFLTPCEQQFVQRVKQALSDIRKVAPSLKYVLWESVYCDEDFHYHPSGREQTKFDKVCGELRLVEGELSDGTTLIYYLPTTDAAMARKQADWFSRFLNEAGERTICAFSAVAGSPEGDHLGSHPFWEVLRQTDHPTSTPVMPILNTGGVHQGGGYWPNFPVDLFEEYLFQQEDFPIAGFVHCMRNIPKKGSLADAFAWVAGMSMWRRRHPKDLLQTWCRGHFPDGDFSCLMALLKKARSVILELSFFKDSTVEAPLAEGVRCRVDTVLAMIKEIEYVVKNSLKFRGFAKRAVKEMFQLFIKDARRNVLQFAYDHDVSISSSMGSDFQGEGVWTQLSSGGVGGGAVSAGRVTLLDEPHIGEDGTPSHKVHWEVNIEV
jgi:hypothetical protein